MVFVWQTLLLLSYVASPHDGVDGHVEDQGMVVVLGVGRGSLHLGVDVVDDLAFDVTW